ncbi:MAG: hypothetical protein ACMUEL_04450 [Flavobacteriales bacterium Tduv]
MGISTYFLRYKSLVLIRKGSLQRISSYACLAFYGGYGHNLHRTLELL